MLESEPNLAFSRIQLFGDTPMHAAAGKGHTEIVALLLEHGADANVRDQNGQAPLHDAASNGHFQVVRLLLAKGADVNAEMHDDLTPLHNAARSGNAQIVRLLLDRGADVNAKSADGKTPLNSAESEGHSEVAEILRQRGGVAKPKPPFIIIKRPTGALTFKTKEDLLSAVQSGLVRRDETVWVDGVSLCRVDFFL
jgi:ankyrin repeat protein